MEVEATETQPNFHCLSCNYYTTRSNDLLKHNKTLKHITNSNKPSDNNIIEKKTYTCNICDKLFQTHGGLWKHKQKACLKKEEPNILKYYCEKCNYTTKLQKDYNKHINTKKHINMQMPLLISDNNEAIKKNPKTYSCFICNFVTKKTTDYKRHCQTIKHNNNNINSPIVVVKKEIHKCQNCNKEYTDRTGLWRHKKKCICNKEENIIQNDTNEPQNLDNLIEENKLLKQFIKDIIFHYHNDVKLFKAYLETKA